jgi:hypothetical protein
MWKARNQQNLVFANSKRANEAVHALALAIE